MTKQHHPLSRLAATQPKIPPSRALLPTPLATSPAPRTDNIHPPGLPLTPGPAAPPPRALISSRPPSCPCSPWRPARPASPWRCGWPRCWGPRPAGSPARSAGTRGPASRRSRLPPAGREEEEAGRGWGSPSSSRRERGPLPAGPNPTLAAICSSSVMLLRSGSPGMSCLSLPASFPAQSLPSPPAAAIPASAAEAAAALLASSSCRCLCSSMETRRPAPGLCWGPRQTRSRWRRGPTWPLPPRPGSGS
uniref:Uncharacterized protein n=1 Tax=Strix occidentalis caurina TaxID=311401 RepID=A0A8D0FPL2_STROC